MAKYTSGALDALFAALFTANRASPGSTKQLWSLIFFCTSLLWMLKQVSHVYWNWYNKSDDEDRIFLNLSYFYNLFDMGIEKNEYILPLVITSFGLTTIHTGRYMNIRSIPKIGMQFRGSKFREQHVFLTQKNFCQLVLSLVEHSGIWVSLSLVAFTLSAMGYAWQLIWIKAWTEASSFQAPKDSNQSGWVLGLVLICLMNGI